jgi:hypothetical protein
MDVSPLPLGEGPGVRALRDKSPHDKSVSRICFQVELSIRSLPLTVLYQTRHVDRYLDEFEFRFNNRHNPVLFRDTLLRLLATSNLEYEDLTKKEAA